MTQAIRKNLLPAASTNVTNAGLELGSYLTTIGDRNAALTSLTDRICQQGVPDIYRRAFERWEANIDRLPFVAKKTLAVSIRMIVGLGTASARETGITLHRQYGVPFIPGSALKGIASGWARDAAMHEAAAAIAAGTPLAGLHPLAPGGDDATILFGTQNAAAYITWLDAWYVPKSADRDQPLAPDVMTPHHPEYNSQGGETDRPPWDFDDPNPVPFLSARGTYLVAVSGPSQNWSNMALQILTRALAESGVGAKTSSGYGRLAP